MKKYLLVFAFSSLNIFTCQSFSSGNQNEMGLPQAENSCSPDFYKKILESAAFSPLTVSNSLPNAIYKCHKSGNLSKMISTNLNYGGDIAKSDEFTRYPNSYFPHGYPANPLGFLQLIQATQNLTALQSQDIAQAISLLDTHPLLKQFLRP